MNEVQRANVAVVEQLARATEERGPVGLLELLNEIFHPDWEWHPGLVGLSRLSYTGREEFRGYLEQMRTTSRRVELHDWEVRPAGDEHVLLTGELRYESHDSEHVDIDVEYAVLYRLEDGLLRSGRSFDQRKDAEEAAMALTDAQA